MNRRGALAFLGALAACRRDSALPEPPQATSGAAVDDEPVLPPRQIYPEPPDSAALASGAIERLREAEGRSPFLRCEIGGRPVLLLFAARVSVQRWRPQVAMARLARRLGLDVVPTTTWRRAPLSTLLGAADAAARTALADAATFPDGAVAVALTSLPERTTTRGTAYSNEAARWTRLAEGIEAPTAEAARAEQSFVAMLVLDYLSGNLFRRSAEEAEDGRLFLVDNRSAFSEHPEARAVDAQLDRLKRVQRFPGALGPALARLDERAADEDFRAGDYETWLVHRRPIREVLQRARALRGLVESRGQ